MNSWGRDLRPDLETEFGELLRACDAVPGIERIRFTSPHPKDFRAPVVTAIAECPSVCEHVHLPAQSGSSRVLKAMRRTYDRDRYLRLVETLRDAVPDLALGTDLIVGFPGESDVDFEETLSLVDEVRFDSAFTFIYLAAGGDRSGRVARIRYPTTSSTSGSKLSSSACSGSPQNGTPSASDASRRCSSRVPSRTDPSLARGRTRRNTTVNFAGLAAAGDLVDVLIEESTSTTLRGRVASLVAA